MLLLLLTLLFVMINIFSWRLLACGLFWAVRLVTLFLFREKDIRALGRKNVRRKI